MSMEQVRQAERNIQNIAVWWHNVDGTGQTARKNRQNTAVWWHNVDGTGYLSIGALSPVSHRGFHQVQCGWSSDRQTERGQNRAVS